MDRRRWQARLRRLWARHGHIYPTIEIVLAAASVLIGITSYLILTGVILQQANTPSGRTLLLVLNLLPLMGLLVLIGRRLVLLRLNRERGLAGSRMHVRLVALFSAIAAVPTLLVVVFASLLFQFGTQFWFSDRVRTVLENSEQVALAYVEENKKRIVDDIDAMGSDLYEYSGQYGIDTPGFAEGLAFQVAARNLTEASVFTPAAGDYLVYASANMEGRPLKERIFETDMVRARSGQASILLSASDRVEAVVRIDPILERYVYVSRRVDPAVLQSAQRAQSALSEYSALQKRSRSLQWQFNLALFVIALLILAAAIMSALWLANRLVEPIGRLVSAAERVGGGDLSARVDVRSSNDELGTLARSFNRMTEQLKSQTNALVSANEQLNTRRQFTEAVLGSVSAGVISVDNDGVISLASRSAAELLETPSEQLIGASIRDAVPEFGDLLDEVTRTGQARGQVRIARGAEVQTLLVRMAEVSGGKSGFVLTFDDITQQLSDQRRAAWADVARRIAHEIKNPLTPIQLSAERLQRRYGKSIEDGADTFRSLTDTIIRQVGDLRQMVDEFSSFARMPKPVFRRESILDIARQTLFLQEVAHQNIRFVLDIATDLPLLVCDRRQLSQAITNLLKNAAEAVTARQQRDGGEGEVRLHAGTASTGGKVMIGVSDDGLGLPANLRDRLTEPYVTTRARGTGLGLAIVKKIVEEHGGTLELADRIGGGTDVTMSFDPRQLQAQLEPDADEQLAAGGNMWR
jgi:two-component system nitrogen regulation sensor histidine kinase NtrY